MQVFARRSLLSLAAVCLVVVGAIASAFGQYDGSLEVPADLKPGFDSITAQQAEGFLNVLAGPTFAGRGTGQPGFLKAAHWVAGKCAEFGLEPMGAGGTYFQMMPMPQVSVVPETTRMTVGDALTIEAPGNLGFQRFVGQPEVAGTLAFVRLVGEPPAIADDVKLEDKIVIYTTSETGGMRSARSLAGKRPAAVLRVVDDTPASSTQVVRPGGRTRSTSISGTIRRAAAEQILKDVGGDPAWLDPSTTNTTTVNDVDKTATIQIRTAQQENAYPNVLAWIEGSDPELRNEYLVIGAHLDHLGKQGDTIYFGADDNGSGSTAVLSIARAMALNPVKPKRSVLFIWFTGEEMGLLGSGYYCDNPILPLDDMICMLNVDMVGRNEEKADEAAADNVNTIHLIGSKQGDPALHDVIMRANQHVNFQFEYDEEGVFGRSDQANFYRKANKSVAFLFGGFHPDYHQPSDQPTKINYDKIAAAARLFYTTIYYAAEHGPFPIPAKTESSSQ